MALFPGLGDAQTLDEVMHPFLSKAESR